MLQTDDINTVYNSLAAGQLDRLEEQRRQDDPLATQQATIHRQITNITNVIADGGHSMALINKLAALESQERSMVIR